MAEKLGNVEVPEIKIQDVSVPSPTTKLGMILFFLVHFGIFMLAHFIFLSIILGLSGESTFRFSDASTENYENILGIFIFFIGLLVSHGVSFLVNFIGQREYEYKTVEELFVSPYQRVFLMHVVIIFGGFLALLFEGMGLAILLVIGKILFDVMGHELEHRKHQGLK